MSQSHHAEFCMQYYDLWNDLEEKAMFEDPHATDFLWTCVNLINDGGVREHERLRSFVTDLKQRVRMCAKMDRKCCAPSFVALTLPSTSRTTLLTACATSKILATVIRLSSFVSVSNRESASSTSVFPTNFFRNFSTP